jgi:hypothetical protein
MRLVFRDIEAANPDEAARLASAKPTDDAESLDDCEGLDYSAVVDREGGDEIEERCVVLRADGGEIEPGPEHVTNRTRASWAEACVSVFIQHTGCDREDALGDLLCDLMHWAVLHDFDLAAALDRALGHFEEELVDEGQAPPAQPSGLLAAPRLFQPSALLLEALEDLVPHAVQEVDDRKATGIGYEDLEEAVETARAALAKAKGGAQ